MALSKEQLAAILEQAKARNAARLAALEADKEAVGHATVSVSSINDAKPATVGVSSAVGQVPVVSSVADKPADKPITTATPSGYKLAGDGVTSAGLTLNAEQLSAVELGIRGDDFCLIGPAGSGKTTTTREVITRVQRASHCLPIPDNSKMLIKGMPGIVVLGFTNRAVNNIRKGLPLHLQSQCMTFHKLIEFGPVFYEIETDDGPKSTMRFEPMRHRLNPLPHISVVIIEEASMVGTELWDQFMSALPNPSKTQFIFLGDLNQIPPVFGPSILGFKMVELPTIELVQIYRQALLSPIISLATDVRTNNSFKLPRSLSEVVVHDNGEHGKLTIHPWKQRVPFETAVHFMKRFLPTMIDNGVYDPEEDQILCPYNKSFGTVELNKIISDHLAKKRGATVWEVIARYNKTYWAVGDRVLFDRHEAVITEIKRTNGYIGKVPQTESPTLNRWGFDPNGINVPQMSALEILNALETAKDDEDGKNLASHTLTIEIPDLGKTEVLNTAGAINSLQFCYALTIHKSQGSEWRRVFLFLHNSHSTLLSRELLYTGVTRAREELYIICEGDNKGKPNSLLQAANRAVIPGTTLREKIAHFANLTKQLVAKAGQARGAKFATMNDPTNDASQGEDDEY
jgi:exodeoxyribonuclease V alpha subunit